MAKPMLILGRPRSSSPADIEEWVERMATKLESLDLVENIFCPTGPGGGIDPTCGKDGGGGGAAEAGKKASAVAEKDHVSFAIARETTTPPPPGAFLSDDVHADDNKDGITDAARVGVCGDCTDGDVPKLPNLNPMEREVEKEFIDAYEKDPEGMAANFRQAAIANAKPGMPPSFETDAAKNFHAAWRGDGLTPEERSQVRATLNLPLHQTANLIAKNAMLQQMDSMKPGEEIMVTVGGCGAGKGWALSPDAGVKPAMEMAGRSKAIWDSAGDQNATENPWLQKAAEERGLKVNYLFVHADPYARWADPKSGVIQRANNPKDGRMVDAMVFTDSYAIGAKNHEAFYEKNKDNPNAKFVFVDATGGKPQLVDAMPSSALHLDRESLFRFATDRARNSPANNYVKRGAQLNYRIWKGDSIQ